MILITLCLQCLLYIYIYIYIYTLFIYLHKNAINTHTHIGISNRTCTGELASQPNAKDVKFISFSLSFHGEELIQVFVFILCY